MAFTTPKTYVVGAVLPAADLNTYERDNIRYLKGLDGEIVLSDYVDFPSTAQGDIFYHDGTKLARLAAGTSGYVLKTQGASANPIWAGGISKVIRKAATESVNNSSTLQNDDDFLLTLGANEVWLVELTLLLQDAGSIPDMKFGWSYPVGCTISWGAIAKDTGAASGSGWMQTSAIATDPSAISVQTDVLTTGTTNVTSGAILRAIVVNGSNAGTLNFQWAQNTAAVQNSSILINSCMVAYIMT